MVSIAETQASIRKKINELKQEQARVQKIKKSIPQTTQRQLRQRKGLEGRKFQRGLRESRGQVSQAETKLSSVNKQIEEYQKSFDKYLRTDAGKLQYAKENNLTGKEIYGKIAKGYAKQVFAIEYSTPYGKVIDRSPEYEARRRQAKFEAKEAGYKNISEYQEALEVGKAMGANVLSTPSGRNIALNQVGSKSINQLINNEINSGDYDLESINKKYGTNIKPSDIRTTTTSTSITLPNNNSNNKNIVLNNTSSNSTPAYTPVNVSNMTTAEKIGYYTSGSWFTNFLSARINNSNDKYSVENVRNRLGFDNNVTAKKDNILGFVLGTDTAKNPLPEYQTGEKFSLRYSNMFFSKKLVENTKLKEYEDKLVNKYPVVQSATDIIGPVIAEAQTFSLFNPLMNKGVSGKSEYIYNYKKGKFEKYSDLKDSLNKLNDKQLLDYTKTEINKINQRTDLSASEKQDLLLKLKGVITEVKTGKSIITESGKVDVGALDSAISGSKTKTSSPNVKELLRFDEIARTPTMERLDAGQVSLFFIQEASKTKQDNSLGLKDKTETKQDSKQEVKFIESTSTASLTKQKEKQGQLSNLGQISKQVSKLDTKTETKLDTQIIQRNTPRLSPPSFKTNTRTDQTFNPRPRPRPERPKPDPKKPRLILDLVRKVKTNTPKQNDELFSFTFKRFGKDITSKKYTSKAKAEASLNKVLKGSLARSGTLLQGDKKVSSDLLKNPSYRKSKADPLRVVQKASDSLSSYTERKEIQYFGRKSRKKKRKVSFL